MPRLDYETPPRRLSWRRRLRPYVWPVALILPTPVLIFSGEVVTTIIGAVAALLVAFAAWVLWWD